MTENFKAGDVVQLKSGGPKMTIQNIEEWNGEKTAWCQWFDKNNPMAQRFTLASLTTALK